MVNFNPESLRKKLNEFSIKGDSIPSLSKWLIEHRKHSETIVKIWFQEFKKAKTSAKILAFLYLAHDVLETSKKNGSEIFSKEFSNVLGECFQFIAKHRTIDAQTLKALNRLLKIWEQKQIYDINTVETFRQLFYSNFSNIEFVKKSKYGKASTSSTTPIASTSSTRSVASTSSTRPTSPTSPESPKIYRVVDSLLDIFYNLEHYGTKYDETIKELIKQFPTKYFDVEEFKKHLENYSQLNNDSGASGAGGGGGSSSSSGDITPENWLKFIDDVDKSMKTFVKHLSDELDHRKNLVEWVNHFINRQRESHQEALDQCRDILAKISEIREEYKSYLKKCLPSPTDLSKNL